MSEHRHLSVVPEIADEQAGPLAEEQFEAWYRSHHARLRSMCDRMLRDGALAEDIAQETLLRAWTRRDQFAAGAEMGPWLRTVARNLCIEAMRARSRAVPSSGALPDFPDADADPTFPLERAEEHAAVREAMLTLSVRHRAMLYARDVHGIDYAELATREGLTENATRAVLFRARRILRDKVAAATRAVGAAILLLRIRTRNTAQRSIGMLGQPVIAAAAHGAIAGAFAVVLTVGGGAHPSAGTYDGLSAGSVRTSVNGAGGLAGAAGAHETAVASPSGTSSREPARVAVSVQRATGEVATKTTVKNPVTGEDDYVWTRVWREHGNEDEDPSVVLGAADTAGNTACSAAADQCGDADAILEGDPTP